MDYEVRAVARYVPMSAQKVRLVIDQVRGMNANEALDRLDFMPQAATKPVYKLILLLISHPPVVVDNDCEYPGKVLPLTRESVKTLQRCSLEQFIDFLSMLESMGIYDSSLIILQADTGAGQIVELKQMQKEMQKH